MAGANAQTSKIMNSVQLTRQLRTASSGSNATHLRKYRLRTIAERVAKTNDTILIGPSFNNRARAIVFLHRPVPELPMGVLALSS